MVTWNVLWTIDAIINKPMVPSVNENKHEICWKADVRRNNNQRPPQALWYFGHMSSPWVHETIYGKISNFSRKVLFPQYLHTWYRMFSWLRKSSASYISRTHAWHCCRASSPKRLGTRGYKTCYNNPKRKQVFQNKNRITISQYWGQSRHQVKRLRKWLLKVNSRRAGTLWSQQRMASRTGSDGWCRTDDEWMTSCWFLKQLPTYLPDLSHKLYGEHVSLSSQAGKTLKINKAHDGWFHNSLSANIGNLYYILGSITVYLCTTSWISYIKQLKINLRHFILHKKFQISAPWFMNHDNPLSILYYSVIHFSL